MIYVLSIPRALSLQTTPLTLKIIYYVYVIFILEIQIHLIISKMGVEIEIMKAGDGKTYPEKGQKISCHYVLKLTNGKKIDSSRDRGKPFVFTVGKGEVIKGWDEGLTRMSVGERSKLTISPDMGYGSKQVSSIPANSVLEFDVELLMILK